MRNGSFKSRSEPLLKPSTGVVGRIWREYLVGVFGEHVQRFQEQIRVHQGWDAVDNEVLIDFILRPGHLR